MLIYIYIYYIILWGYHGNLTKQSIAKNMRVGLSKHCVQYTKKVSFYMGNGLPMVETPTLALSGFTYK